jgi:hypothetical protein
LKTGYLSEKLIGLPEKLPIFLETWLFLLENWSSTQKKMLVALILFIGYKKKMALTSKGS